MSKTKLHKVLYIDLTHKKFKVEKRPELFEKFLGGTGVATQLLFEECPEGIDPFSEENPIILAVGALTNLYPLASKTVAMFKSPHTGNLGESHVGGRSAIAIRSAGYGAIVIKGKSDIPIYLSIHEDKIKFKNASTIWGLGNTHTVGRIIRENEPGAGIRSIMRIGIAGENLLTYASVTTETYRHFGRLGLGAIFGSKKLKAIVISGRKTFEIENKKEYRETYDYVYKTAVNSALMKKYHDLGTPANINSLNKLGGFPTKNLQAITFEHASEISGESFAENYLGRRLACSHCPIGCVHIATLREPYNDEPYFYKTSMISYDYEPIYAVGSLLGGYSIPGMLKLMVEVEKYGLDIMSLGVVLAWATEALEKGIISEEDTLGLNFQWNDYETYQKAIRLICIKENEFYDALGKGVVFASEKFGGKDFALAFGGNEMPGYSTGPASHIGYFVGARHSHLDNGGYSMDQKKENIGIPPKELAKKIVNEEEWRQVLSSLVLCFFARSLYTPEVISKILKVVGYDFSEDDLKNLGESIYKKKYEFKFREGFSLTDYSLPNRIYETPVPNNPIKKDYVEKTISEVNKLIRS